MNSRKFSFLFISFLLIFSAITTLSCEIGLGEAVDTQVPGLSIETPPVDAVIRGSFAIGGKWNDDGEVKSAKISLKPTGSNSSNKSPVTFDGIIKADSRGKGTWSCLVAPKDEAAPIKDGKYEIEVSVFDAAGHVTRENRLITIDNTPPIIVLDRPATKDGTDKKYLDAYGQKLSLLGRAADDNEVDSIEINFYKDDNTETPVHTVRKDGVSNTIDETVAVFGDENYDTIYGPDKDNTKYYTCSIKAYDKARKYPESYPYTDNRTEEQKKEDNHGNDVDHYYLYKDLSDNLLKDYSVTDLYKMTSGNYVPETAVQTFGFTVDQVLAALQSSEIKVEKGKFSLNPENNPYYSISGFSQITDYNQFGKSEYAVENGGQIFIDMYPGIDGYALYDLPFENNYRIIMYPCTKGQDGTIVINEDNKKIISSENIEVKPQGNGYKLVVALTKKDLGDFGNFIFRIGGIEKTEGPDGQPVINYIPKGKDKVGNDLIVKYKEKIVTESGTTEEKEVAGADVQYGFKFVPSGAAPKLNVEDIAYQHFKKDSELIIQGYMDIEDGTPSLSIKLGGRPEIILNEKTQETANSYFKKADKDLGYQFKYKFENLSSSDSKVTVTADGGTKYNTVKEMVVNYDEVPPTVKEQDLIINDNKTPDYVTAGENWYKTNQLNVKVKNIIETGSGISVVKAGVKGGELTTLNKKTEEETENIYYEGLVTFAKQGGNNIVFELTDKAGNTTSYEKTVYIDVLAPVFDDVNIISIDGESGDKAKLKLVNGKNPVKVIIEAKDAALDSVNGSGIKEISISNIVGNINTGIKVEEPEGGNVNQFTINIPVDVISTLEGSGPVFFKITDNVGNSYTLNGFTLTVDTAEPELEINDITDADISTDVIDVNGSIKISGTASDNNGLASVSLKNKNTGKTVEFENKDQLNSWNFTINSKELSNKTTYNYEITVTDKAGNSVAKETPVFVNQASDRPVITLTTVAVAGNGSSNPANLKNSSTLYGMVSDDDGAVSRLEYCINGAGDGAGSGSGEDLTWIDIPVKNGSWNIPTLEDGTQTLLFRVTEKDGITTWTSSGGSAGGGSSSGAENNPVIKGSDGEVINEGGLKLRVDTQPPEKTNVMYSVKGYIDAENRTISNYDDYKINVKDEYRKNAEGETEYKDTLSILGGIHNEFKLKLDAYDANGINKVYAYFAETPENILSPGSTKTVYLYKYKQDGIVHTVYSDTKKENNTSASEYAVMRFYKDPELKTEVTNSIIGITPEYVCDYNRYEITVDVSQINNGTYSLIFGVEDSAGLKNESTVQVAIDKNGPVVEVTGPSSNTTVSESTSVYGNVDSSSLLFYGIGPAKTGLPAGLTSKGSDVTYNRIKDAALSWFVYFDNNTDTSLSSTHSKNMNEHIKDLYLYNSSPIEIGVYGEVTPVEFKIIAIDEVGNKKEFSHTIMIDPLGDRPTVEISSPATKATVGGVVKLYGTALDLLGTNIGVENIWLQLISDKARGGSYYDEDRETFAPFEITANDLKFMKMLGVEGVNDVVAGAGGSGVGASSGSSSGAGVQNKLYNMKTGELLDSHVSLDSLRNPEEYALKISDENFNGSSWSYEINTKGELDPEEGTPINAVGVRIFAQDKDKKLSIGNECLVFFDADKPVISDVYLEADDGRVIEYKEDMYIKGGNWKLKGTVKDKDKVKSVTVSGSPAALTPIGGSGDKAETAVTFEYPLSISSNGVGAKKLVIKATDNTTSGEPNVQTLNIIINYDNKAPVLVSDTDSSYNINTKVQQKDSFYTFGSKVTEEAVDGVNQSGFAYVAAYFVRPGQDSSVGTIYNPLLSYKDGGSDIPGYKADMRKTEIRYADKDKTDGLFWIKEQAQQDSTAASVFKLTKSNPNIHVNSLVKVNGAYYLIESITPDGLTITLDGNPKIGSSGGGSGEILIANAVIIDNTVQEAEDKNKILSDGYYKSPINDDGDRMMEGVSKTGASWQWQASICSRNIPDGPIEIHYVAFDKAGNSVEKVVNGKVENNSPRLAGLSVWSDYNKNNTFDQENDRGELYTYNYKESPYTPSPTAITDKLVVSGNDGGPDSKGTAFRIIKDEFTLIPEIVGGNGNLFYSFKITGVNGNNINTGKIMPLQGKDGSSITGRDDGIDETGNDEEGYYRTNKQGHVIVQGNKAGQIKIDSSILNQLTNNEDGEGGWNNPTWFEYTIFDSTGDDAGNYTNKNSNSLTATFQLALNIQYKDSENPSVKTDRFNWNGTGEGNNNLCWLEDNETPLGHIELEGDLPSEIFNEQQGVKDKDPKVSGKIKITGTAEDNILLKSLEISFPGIAGSGAGAGAAGAGAAVGAGAGAGTSGDAYIKVAVYDEATGTLKKTDAADIARHPDQKWSFDVEDISETSEKGDRRHKVKWTFTVDTTVTTVGADKEFKIRATDMRGNGGAGAVSLENKDSKYRIDIVPYITGVNTSLSGLKKSRPSVYSRSAQGHYSVNSTETVIVTGFNLSGATFDKEGKVKLDPASKKDCVTAFENNPSFVKLPVGKIKKSGAVELYVNGIPTLNNMNKNDAVGNVKEPVNENNYKNYAYNRQPNGDNNNNLTDDVYFDVWEINKEAVSVKETGDIIQPIMKINPESQMVNFAYSNGPRYFSMANGISSSYTLWQGNYARNTSTGFTVDSNGKTHGITVGLDTNPDEGMSGRMTYMYSGWGTGDKGKDGNYKGWHTSRIDTIGIPTSSGYSILEDRFLSPSLTTVVHGNSTYVYMAYYDDLKQQIRFKYGNLKDASDEYDENKWNEDSYHKERGYSFGQFMDQSNFGMKTTSGDNNSNKAFDTDNNKKSYSVLAGNGTNIGAGEYVSIAVVDGGSTDKDVVVATWYDAENNGWMYSYKLNPNNDNDLKESNYKKADAGGYWAKPLLIKEFAGEYCKIAVDNNKGIHIAAKDTMSSDLVYAYLPLYNEAPKVVTVDAGGLVGSNITLDVGMKNGKPVPYIGYFADSIKKPKVAYLVNGIDKVDGESVVPAGDVNEKFTGSWECSVIPTASRLKEDYINVGIWKDKKNNGEIINSTKTSSTGDENEGNCYGNGTANPILGYATRIGTSGRIETAQMK